MKEGERNERSGNCSRCADPGRKAKKGTLASVRPDDLGASGCKRNIKACWEL